MLEPTINSAPLWAGSINLGSNSRTRQTHARQEDLRTYDNVKKYGAERVSDRDRRMFQPDGLRLGNFLLFPEVAFNSVFEDNPSHVPGAPRDDLRFELEPRLVIRSRLPRHILDIIIGGRMVRHWDEDDYDTLDGYADALWKIDINNAHALYGALHTGLEHEEWTDTERPEQAGEPVPVFKNRAEVGIKRDAGRLAASLTGDISSADFDDVRGTDGAIIDQDHRDRTVYGTTGELTYRFSPGYQVTASLRGEVEENQGTATIDRDATTLTALFGLNMEVNPLLRLVFKGGYSYRDFDQNNLEDFGAGVFAGELQWLINQRTTLYFGGEREISSTGFEDANARIDTKLYGRAEYEIWRNLVATADLEYQQIDFNGTDRKDDVYTARVGFEYLRNKNTSFNLSYEYQDRDSSAPAYDYESNRFMLGMKLRY